MGPPVGLVFSGGAVFGQMNPIASAPPTTPAVTVSQSRRRRQRYDARTRFTLD
jgi:hypothetical protein